MPNNGETWERYAQRLEQRVKKQRDMIASLQALRGSDGNKHDRARIATLERQLGKVTSAAMRRREERNGIKEQLDKARKEIKRLKKTKKR